MKTKFAVLITLAVMLFGSCGHQSQNSSIAEMNNEPFAEVLLATGGGLAGQSNVPAHINKQDFLEKVMNYEKNPTEWVFEGNRPCLIDFYADWCGPCRTAAPILEKLASEYSGKIDVYKIDTEAEK